MVKRKKSARSSAALLPAPEVLTEHSLSIPTAAPSRPWLEGGVALLDASRRITHVSEALAAWLGGRCEQLVGAPFENLVQRHCPESGPVLARAWAEATPWAAYQFAMALPETDGQDGNGKAAAAWLRLEVARNEGGWFVRLNSTLPSPRELVEAGSANGQNEDPETRQLRQRLLRAESQLERLLQRWPGVLFSQRADFSFQYVSPKIEELTGVPADQWRQQPRRFWEVVHEADVEELRRQCEQAARTREGVTTTFRIRHATTGCISYILEHRQAAVSRSGVALGYEGLWLDVTRQTIAEKRLSTAAWKETLALLTMGLAHDFSNVMSGILSLSELLLAQSGAEDPRTPSLELIKQSSLQAGQLVRRIVNLHRSKTGTRQYVDLNQAVTELVELVGKVLPRRIRVQTELASEQLAVYLDPVEFRQVVLNLALNAADAMPKNGVLTLRVRAHTAPQELAHGQGKFPRLPCVCLSVQDTGTGISARHLPHLFDPFFTTKPLTKGSGLGLYNARMFVEGHNGAVSVDSVEGAGTTFHLWLPQADFTEAERLGAESGGGRRSLLLVGPAGGTSDTITEFLRTHNYSVLATHAPERALELLATEETAIHGVLVLATPGDALLSLLPALRERGPKARILLHLVGESSDQMDTQLLHQADLVLAGNIEENVFLQKLNSLFTAESPL